MATYIEGVEDYIPQIQVFEPDLNMYSKIINERQSKYDKAREQISDIYNSMLNSPMLREADIETRNEYFKIIDSDIKKISGMDLSLRQNQEIASNVFTQLLNNKNVAHDMAYTRQAQNALEYGETLKTTDPDSYWDGMSQLIQMDMDAYSKSSDDDAMKMNAPKYTKRVNLEKEMMEMINDLDFNITEESVTTQLRNDDGTPKLDNNGNPIYVEGKWIEKRKNGQLAIPVLSELFYGMYADRGDIQEYYKQKARYERMSYAYKNADKYGGDINVASMDYVRAKSSELEERLNQKALSSSAMKSNQRDEVEDAKKRLEYELEPYEERSLKKIIDDYNNESEIYAKGEGFASNQLSKFYTNNGELSPEMFDSLYGGLLVDSEILRVATIASMKNASVEYKSNPYTEMYYEHQYALQRDSQNHKYRMLEEEQRAQNNKNLELYKAQLNAFPGVNTDVMTPIDAGTVEGSLSNTEYEAGSEEATRLAMKQLNSLYNSMSSEDIISNQSVVLNSLFENMRDSANSSITDAKRDFIEVVSRYMYATGDGESFEDAYNECKGNVNQLYAKYKNTKLDLGAIDGRQLDGIYKYAVQSRSYNTDALKNARQSIDKVDALTQSFDAAYKELKDCISTGISQARLDDDEIMIVKAYLGLRKDQSIDKWDGQYASYNEFAEILSRQNVRNPAKYYANSDSDDDVEDNTAQYLMSKIVTYSPPDTYAKNYSGFRGFGSSYARAMNYEFTNGLNSSSRKDFIGIARIGQGAGNGNDVIVTSGGFKKELPSSSDASAIASLANFIDDFGAGKKNADKSITATVSSVAGSDDNYMAVQFNFGNNYAEGGDYNKKEDNHKVTVYINKNNKQWRNNPILAAANDSAISAQIKIGGSYKITNHGARYICTDGIAPEQLPTVKNIGQGRIQLVGSYRKIKTDQNGQPIKNNDGSYQTVIADVSELVNRPVTSVDQADALVNAVISQLENQSYRLKK